MGLAASAGRFIFGLMPSAWKIIAYRRPDKIGEPSIREFFLVALPEKDAAIAVLRMREGYDDAELEVIGEAPANPSLGWISSPAKFSVYGRSNDQAPQTP